MGRPSTECPILSKLTVAFDFDLERYKRYLLISSNVRNPWKNSSLNSNCRRGLAATSGAKRTHIPPTKRTALEKSRIVSSRLLTVSGSSPFHRSHTLHMLRFSGQKSWWDCDRGRHTEWFYAQGRQTTVLYVLSRKDALWRDEQVVRSSYVWLRAFAKFDRDILLKVR